MSGIRLAAGVVCAAALVAGCGNATVEGEAQSAPEATDPVFSPCDDIPDEAVAALGMDPASESRDILGVSTPGWKGCVWRHDSRSHFLRIEATVHPLSEVRENPVFGEFEDVEVGDREGVQFRMVADKGRTGCYVAVESDGGAVLIAVREGRTVPDDPCGIARAATLGLLSWIPE
ncbi:DUF3558 domain-containing protein [Rhodococcus gannanensis]|uniref:DUF3558 domain-containing protein n=1 Tax=Rhodococcus gannanensis TaxID=1960308 RepID=A0ABW4P042_9NOCA